MKKKIVAAAVFAVLACGASVVSAAAVVSASPQGEVAQVRQVVVTFSEPVVPFGDLRLPDPFGVVCQGAAPAGTGRWSSDRVWLYDFKEALPPGTRCTATLRPDWKPSAATKAGSAGSAAAAASATASPVTGRTSFAFSTGGPAVVSIQPSGGEVEEDQHFLLRVSGAAVESTVVAHAWCEVEGLGEKIPLQIIGGDVRAQVLKARRVDAAAAQKALLVRCARPLPNGAQLRVVWGKGIAAQANPQIATSIEQQWRYAVRAAFTADFSCERERADAPCLPIRPMTVRFSAPIARDVAAQIRLKPTGTGAGETVAPVFDKDDKAVQTSAVTFPIPLAESAAYDVVLPSGVKDDAGRPLSNASSFPLRVQTGTAPPIAKFAAAPFGIVEHADGSALPVTLRHVQGELRPSSGAAKIRTKRLLADADILAWYAKVQKFHETQMTAQELGLPERDWFSVETDTDAKGRTVRRRVERRIGTREVSLLAKEPGTTAVALPQLEGGDPRPFEVVGIPFAQTGYHVVEIESPRLGQALLDKRAPMFVRTGVLVTNLGVHFKLGRENSVVWVTTLDRGKPVEGADVTVNDCNGKPLWSGRTDAKGLAVVSRTLPETGGECVADSGYFVTARRAEGATADVAFVFSSWQKGIEPWRFHVPTGRSADPDLRAATVFDRTLFRAGETVSMKHFIRVETMRGLAAVPKYRLPTQVKLVHQGSGEEITLPIAWRGDGRSATTTWPIPPAAKLGVYDVSLERAVDGKPQAAPGGEEEGGPRASWQSGSFRVEEFRLPLVDARLSGPKATPVAPASVQLDVQMAFFSGGAMGHAPLRASAVLKSRAPGFSGYDDYSFDAPRDPKKAEAEAAGSNGDDSDASEESEGRDGKLVADKVALTTDRNGAASFVVKDLPPITRPSRLDAEVTFADPNGETQTVATPVDLWPSGVVLGVRAASWASNRGDAAFSVVALDTSGKPIKGQTVTVIGRVTQVISTRKRLVGGFYAYDNRADVKDLGTLCSGTTDDRGVLRCTAKLDAAGQVELVAQSKDAQGRASAAAGTVWVTKQGELWFAQDNDDRIDVLPEKKRYEPGETAKLQVRMPFREATALVSVEREGVIATQVVALRGDDPTVQLKVEPEWGPNVYVSVLALRGRIRETPWYSIFTWGWKEPLAWWRSYTGDGGDWQPPTAMVDLAKPAFKLGVAKLVIGLAPHELQVQVTTEKPQYAVRQTVKTKVRVSQDGKPLANAEVAFAAVDEGLLALKPNDSWNLLGAMLQERAWGVETSTAQSEIIGRRHYGRKAVAAGGGGGRGSARELFDTLLLWKPDVTLNANGEATLEVPLNDSLTSFRLVAVADADVQKFGTGSASVRVTQDLQVLSGIPPLVRDGDRFVALMTLRNTTPREMKVRATLQGTANLPGSVVGSGAESIARLPIALPPQDVTIAAGAAQEVVWPVDVPADAFSIAWEAAAEESGGGAAKDRLKVTQLVSAAVPVRVLQATLQQLDAPFSLPVAAPADALSAGTRKRGGLVVAVQPKLTGALPGMRRYFETYPFICLEQKASKSVGLKDAALWASVANTLPTYLDTDGLANYFPPRAEDPAHGSDRLTAYVLAATHEAGFALPPEPRDRMLAGLAAFVEGRIERKFWSPRADLDVRKIAAIEALSRYGKAEPRMLGSVNVVPNVWPTAAVIDWLRILRRMDGIPDRAKRLEEANQILRARLTYAGTTLRFSTEESDFWWWLMDSADANAGKLILAVLDDPAWKDDLPKLVVGSLARQRRGAWLTTTANLWGSLALDKFAAKFESEAIAGRTVASIDDGAAKAVADWAAQKDGGRVTLPWPAGNGTLSVRQDGTGKPWLTVQSLAAIPLKAPLSAGYTVTRTVTPVEQKDKSRWSRGDTMRVRVEVEAQGDMTWVVIADPVPGGATILGSGLGRDSQIATRTEQQAGRAWPAYQERAFEAFRSYYEYLPKGRHVVEYTVRLNNPGRFALPPTRVEAMYAPETFGEMPNAPVEVAP